MSRNRVRAAALSVTLVATVGLTVAGAASSVAATQQDEITSVSSSKPIMGEDITIRGTFATTFERPIELQRMFHDTWKVVETSSTVADGRFQFVTSTTVNRTYRVVAHTFKTDAHTYKLRKTQSESVTPIKDAVSLAISPSVGHVGEASTISMTFAANRIGRPLTQLMTINGEPQDPATGLTQTSKTMTIHIPAFTADQTGTYVIQLVAESWRGAPAVKSNKLTFTVAAATQKDEITELDPADPVKGENFQVRGTIASRLKRPVELQRLFHDTWKVVDTANTDETGRFEFPTSTTVKRTYRVVAHTFAADAHTYKLRKTPARVVTPIEQSIKLVVSPAEVTPRADGAELTFTATVTPTRSGRPLTTYWTQPGNDDPQVLHSDTQTGSKLTFTLPVPSDAAPGTYTTWVVAAAGNGLSELKSNVATFTIK